MKKYVRKPEVVEAVQFTTNNEPDNAQMKTIVEWLVSHGEKARHDGTDIYVENRSRHEVLVSVGDWIVRDAKGRWALPIKSFVFDESFDQCEHEWEAVDDSKHDQCLVCGDTRQFEMQYFGDEVL
jgi:hypothetical protein